MPITTITGHKLGTKHFWTVNRSLIAADLHEAGFDAGAIALVLGTDSKKRVIAKLAHMARTVALPAPAVATIKADFLKTPGTARLVAAAQMTALNRSRLIEQYDEASDEVRELSVDILNAFVRTARVLGEYGVEPGNAIIMFSRLKVDSELLQIRAEATGTIPRNSQHVLAPKRSSASLAALIDVLSAPISCKNGH